MVRGNMNVGEKLFGRELAWEWVHGKVRHCVRQQLNKSSRRQCRTCESVSSRWFNNSTRSTPKSKAPKYQAARQQAIGGRRSKIKSNPAYKLKVVQAHGTSCDSFSLCTGVRTRSLLQQGGRLETRNGNGIDIVRYNACPSVCAPWPVPRCAGKRVNPIKTKYARSSP